MWAKNKWEAWQIHNTYDVDVSNLFVLDPEANDVQNMLQVTSET
jgi:hypothetical protein